MKFLKLTATDNSTLYVSLEALSTISEPVGGSNKANAFISTTLGGRYVLETPEQILALVEQCEQNKTAGTKTKPVA